MSKYKEYSKKEQRMISIAHHYAEMLPPFFRSKKDQAQKTAHRAMSNGLAGHFASVAEAAVYIVNQDTEVRHTVEQLFGVFTIGKGGKGGGVRKANMANPADVLLVGKHRQATARGLADSQDVTVRAAARRQIAVPRIVLTRLLSPQTGRRIT